MLWARLSCQGFLCLKLSLLGSARLNLCSFLFCLHFSTLGSGCVIKHASWRITVKDDRPLVSLHASSDCVRPNHDIIGQSAWFPHRNHPPLAIYLCRFPLHPQQLFFVFWKSGLSVFLCRWMVTICLPKQCKLKLHGLSLVSRDVLVFQL